MAVLIYMHPWSNGYDPGLPNRRRRFNSGRMLDKKMKGKKKMAKAECKKVIGCDEYGREAWLMVSQHRDTDKVEVLSSEEGEPVVYTKSQISELIKELKKYVK